MVYVEIWLWKVLEVREENKTRQRYVDEDMKQIGIRKCYAQDRTVWRNGAAGKRLNLSALAPKNGPKMLMMIPIFHGSSTLKWIMKRFDMQQVLRP
jgi:hypothetical protein